MLFIHEIKRKGYDVIGVEVFHFRLMGSTSKKGLKHPYQVKNNKRNNGAVKIELKKSNSARK